MLEKEAFDEVKTIILHRDFEGWINAVAAQKFRKPRFKEKMSFRLKSQINNFRRYEQAVAKLPGLHVEFKELFSTDIEMLAERLRNYLELPGWFGDHRKEQYDLFGKLLPYQRAFVPFHDGRNFLDKGLQNIAPVLLMLHRG